MEKYFEKVIGYDPLKMELTRILDIMKKQRKVRWTRCEVA